ncbi:MAG: hypothetical protein H6842_15435 [Rhodospirillaceae bacterium]|nr:hypothetical protein [Rhodospirillaceae bacterium]
MRLIALLAVLVPALADAACPEPGDTTPFTIFEQGVPTTVYPGRDGVTILRTELGGGNILTFKMYRGLFMLAGPDSQGGGYAFEYGAPLDPIFAFNTGDRFEIPVTSTENGETMRYTGVYEIVGTDTVTIGDCAYDTVIIDHTQVFDAWAAPTATEYYSPDLGIVLQRLLDHDFSPGTPRITSTTDRITDDPSMVVPR